MNDVGAGVRPATTTADQIRLWEDRLFALEVWQQTTPDIIRIFTSRAFTKVHGIISAAIAHAKQLKPSDEASFQWPYLSPEMERNTKIALRAYAEVYPDRPRKPLMKEEIGPLRLRITELTEEPQHRCP